MDVYSFNNSDFSNVQYDLIIDHLVWRRQGSNIIGGINILSGNFDEEKIKKALSEVLELAPIIRSRIVFNLENPSIEYGFFPAQIDSPDIDFSNFSQDEVLHWLQNEFSKSFDLDKGDRLYRIIIFQYSDKLYILFKFHHLICDGYGAHLIVKKYSELYDAASSELKNSILEHWGSYSGKVKSDQHYLESQQYTADKEYWRQLLSPVVKRMHANSELHNSATLSNKQYKINISLDEETDKHVKKVLLEKQVSQFHYSIACISSAFLLVLDREDLVMVLPVSNRNTSEEKNAAGFYYAPVYLHTDYDGGINFWDHSKNIGRKILKSYRHRKYPASHLYQDLSEHLGGGMAFTDLMFSFEQYPLQINLDHIEFEYEVMESPHLRLPIQIYFRDHGDKPPNIEFIFDTAIYSPETIQDLSAAFKWFYESIDQLGNQGLLNESIFQGKHLNKKYILSDSLIFESRDIVTLYKNVTKKYGDKIALIYEDKKYTYDELDFETDRFASYLVNLQSIKQDDIIAIQLDRNDQLVIALLGILKTGAAFLSIDSNYPESRRKFILEDSHSIIFIDSNFFSDYQSKEISERYYVHPNPESLAYCIYTSGSTGNPKGVLIEHRSISNTLQGIVEQLDIRTDTIHVQLASPSFDAAVWEIFGPLSIGATLCIAPEEIKNDPITLGVFLNEHKITNALIPPALLLLMEKKNLLSLRMLVSAGESPVVKLLRELSKDIVCLNAYGPTETSICSCFYKVDPDDIETTIPIGRPYRNVKMYVLGKYMQFLPSGKQGEIYIGGEGVARSYLNRKDLDKQKFIDHPVDKNERIYRTGDIAFLNQSDEIVFAGRNDEQIKIRGNRVELGEIESKAGYVSGVEHVSVVFNTKAGAEPKIYLFYVGTIDEKSLRKILEKELPSYMVPFQFRQLKSLPVNEHGKISKNLLLQLSYESESDYNSDFADEGLRNLAICWSEVLGISISKINSYSDFFQLGAHSLSAVKLSHLVHERFGSKLEIKEIFSKRDLLSQYELLMSKNEKPISFIPVASESSLYPLTNAQNRIWVQQQLVTGASPFITERIYEIKGDFNPDVFQAAWRSLLTRHEILRTYFVTDHEGIPKQKIISIDDLSENDGFYFLMTSQKYHETSLQPDTWPLTCLLVSEILNGVHRIHIKQHHIIGDAWSTSIMQKELFSSYENLIHNSNWILEPLRIQSKDYAVWESENMYLNSASEAFWMNHLHSPLPSLDIKTDQQIPSKRTYVGSQVRLKIPDHVVKKIESFARNNGTTSYAIYLSCLSVLLNRYSGQTDFVIGVPSEGRSHPDLKNQLGFYVNMLPVRCGYKNINWISHLHDTKMLLLSVLEHAGYPFDHILRKFNEQNGSYRDDLFDVMLVVNDQWSEYNTLPKGLSINAIELSPATALYGLVFNVNQNQDGTFLELDYSTELYTNRFATQMGNHFVGVLENLLEHSEEKLDTIKIITDAEEQNLHELGKGELIQYNSDENIVQAFLNQVHKNPNAIALEYKTNIYSYQQLNELTDLLAGYIKSKLSVAGRDEYIGIQLKRSEWTIISLLAVLKTGAAYLPLNPEHPSVRNLSIAKDAEAKLIVDELFIEEFQSALRNGACTSYNADIHAEDIAYCLFTSGSTGKPKGVVVDHRSVVLRCRGFWQEYGFADNERVLQLASYTFDISVIEILMTLIHGATIVSCEHGLEKSPEALLEILETKEITDLHAVPSLIAAVIDEASQWKDEAIRKTKKLRRVIACGEALPLKTIKNWYGIFNIDLYNLYGPTEICVYATGVITHKEWDYVHIGKALPNTNVYLLDDAGNLVPNLCVGEICIGGISMSSGYLNDPILSDQKFIKDPFSNDGLLYCSGDLGRWNENGDLIFIGRSDHQVKVRGHRIELGEVEHAMKMINRVEMAAVLAIPDKSGTNDLIGFYTGDIDVETLRFSLSENLPSYMIPTKLVVLEQFPLNSNGKIDRKQLAQIQTYTEDILTNKPNTHLENSLALAWSEVLGIPFTSINKEDDFFKLGGDSLKATRLIAVLFRIAGVKLELREIFSESRLSKLCERLEIARTTYKSIEKNSNQEIIPLSEPQKRMWVLSQFHNAALAYRITLGFDLVGKVDPEIMSKAYDRIVSQYHILRTVIRVGNDGLPYQYILNQGNNDFSLKYVDISADPQPANDIGINFLKESLDLNNGPLSKVLLLKCNDTHYKLFILQHHIISDGWSIQVLKQQLLQNYNVISKGINSLDRSDVLQYSDFSIWSEGRNRSDIMEWHKSYWINKLSGPVIPFSLSSYESRPQNFTFKGYNFEGEFNSSVVDKLINISNENGYTLFIILQAIVRLSIFKFSGLNDILIGTPVSGREHPQLQDQIGYCLNTIVLKSIIDSADTLDQYLKKVSTDTREALAHQDYPFDLLIDVLKPERDSSRSPLFDVYIVMQYEEEKTLLLSDKEITITPIDIDLGISIYDISFSFTQKDDAIKWQMNINPDCIPIQSAKLIAETFSTLIRNIEEYKNKTVSQFVSKTTDLTFSLIQSIGNGKPYILPNDSGIISMFVEQVQLHRDQPALIFDQLQLTYGELHQRSDLLAAALKRIKNVSKGEIVGVILEEPVSFILTIWAIIKCGAAYLPIRNDFPPKRIEYILESSGARIVIDHNVYEELSLNKEISKNESDIIAEELSDPLYCMFTSGSTGVPKGILIEKHTILNLISSMKNEMGYSFEGKSMLQYASYGFDASAQEIFSTLCSGGTLELISETEKKDISFVRNKIGKVDYAILPCVLVALIFDGSLPPAYFSKLKILIVSGEQPFLSKSIENFFDEAGIIFQNHYGPTETHVVTWWSRLPHGKSEKYIPAGSPIQNSNLVILNEKLMPVAPGVIGELYISGMPLMRGYVNASETDHSKLIHWPDKNGDKYYKTGDLVRWREDGLLEFIGRNDDQFKIRGFRIEPAEIESVVMDTQLVDQCCIYTQGDGERKNLFVAYRGEAAEEEVWKEIRTNLPLFMHPSAVYKVMNFPVNENGKIDKGKLISSFNSIILPVSKNENTSLSSSILTQLWSSLLGVEVHTIQSIDHFFRIGGNSIMVIRLLGMIHRKFGVTLKLEDIFRYPILSEMSELINQKLTEKEVDPIEIAPIGNDYPLTPMQKRIWASEQLADHAELNTIRVTVKAMGYFNEHLFEKAIYSVVQKHEVLRSVFIVDEDDLPRQKYLSLQEIRKPFFKNHDEFGLDWINDAIDIEEAPLFKIWLEKITDESYQIHFAVHHLIFDGFSMEILLREISNTYTALKNSDLNSSKSILQYKDYVNWNRLKIQTNQAKENTDFWINKLRDFKKEPIVFKENLKKGVKNWEGNVCVHMVSEHAFQKMKDFCKTKGISELNILIASVALLIKRQTGEDNVLIGMPISGRENHPLLGDLIGCLIEIMPMPISISDSDDYLTIMKNISQDSMAYRKHMPFDLEMVTRKLSEKEKGKPNSLFNIWFDFHQFDPLNRTKWDGFVLGEHFQKGNALSKFDLSFLFVEEKNGLKLAMEYNSNIFTESEIQKLLSHWVDLFEVLLIDHLN